MCLINKVINRSLTLAYSLFRPSTEQSNYHFTFGFEGGKLIGIGQNNPIEPNGKAMRLAKYFCNFHFQEFPFLHSETDLIGKLWGKKYINRKITFVNIRLNKAGKLRKSKPCPNCNSILNALDIVNIYWSNNNFGFSKTEENKEIEIFNTGAR